MRFPPAVRQFHVGKRSFESAVLRAAGIDSESNLILPMEHVADSHLPEIHALPRSRFAPAQSRSHAERILQVPGELLFMHFFLMFLVEAGHAEPAARCFILSHFSSAHNKGCHLRLPARHFFSFQKRYKWYIAALDK